jgi:predicted HTH transcriptional regulator
MDATWKETTLQSYVTNEVPESLRLDYKAPKALFDENELCKDVSSFLNSQGGTLIYGMHEDKRNPPRPISIEGITGSTMNRERIDQILTTNIHPRFDPKEYHIEVVQLADGSNVFVVEM